MSSDLFAVHDLPLKTCFLNFLGNMGYMSVKDENFPRAWSFKG